MLTIRTLALLLAWSIAAGTACRLGGRATLPERLQDDAFWGLTSGMSEPPGVFTHSENLVSNETQVVHIARLLRPTGGVYIGVGPEQNFTYISRLRPAMAFIVDIRAENRNLHLMYKALFELSADRGEFLSKLFSRPRPAAAGREATVEELFNGYARVTAELGLHEATRRLIRERLLEDHAFPLAETDLHGIDRAFTAFYSDGPDIHYGRSRPEDPPRPSYRALMTARDITLEPRSYLSSEDAFAVVKDLHARNLIVPLVGDFAGATAIRRVGEYVRSHRATVSAFYASNVEVYLTRGGLAAFCANLASLPYTSDTWFVLSKGLQPLTTKLEACAGRTK